MRDELVRLAKSGKDYLPNPKTRKDLASVRLICVVGGVGVGKNYLMKLSGLPVVGRVTSRSPRPDDDPKVYKYFTNNQLIAMIERGELVQYAVDLGNNVIYGSIPTDYVPNGPTIADIWHWSVTELQNKGFGELRSVSVIAPWDQWKKQLNQRFENRDEPYRKARLEEAIKSLEWTKKQLENKNPNHIVIVNNSSETEQSIKTLVNYANGRAVSETPTPTELIDQLIEQLHKEV